MYFAICQIFYPLTTDDEIDRFAKFKPILDLDYLDQNSCLRIPYGIKQTFITLINEIRKK